MANDIYYSMLSAYDLSTEQQKRNAIFEVNQQIILAGLHNGGFFDVASFRKNPRELDIWTNDYFVQLADLIRFE